MNVRTEDLLAHKGFEPSEMATIQGGRIRARTIAVALLAALLSAACVHSSMAPQEREVEAPAPAAPPTIAAAQTAPIPNPPEAPVSPPAPPPLPPMLPLNEAITSAAMNVFKAAIAQDPDAKFVVIDPLVDGMTGYQSHATRSIQDIIVKVARENFPAYVIQSITPQSLEKQPHVLIGTFTPVNAQNKFTGEREAFRFCLVMIDLKTGKVVAKSVVRTPIAEADSTPTETFGDSPVWSSDPSILAYIATCQGSKVGDPIKPEYIEGLQAAALINEAQDAYENHQYADAMGLYETAHKTVGGDQLRVYNGIYLSALRMGKTQQAQAAFRELVGYGLRRKRLAVKFTFRPGSVRFSTETKVNGNYDMWLQEIASQVSVSHACLQITGHTSPTGLAALNDNLSLLRAEYVQSRLENDEPGLMKRTNALGRGARENIVGTGKDDASDAIDRRVELAPIDPCV